MEGASGAMGATYVAPAGVTWKGQVGQWVPPRPLASYVRICHYFDQNSCIQIYFHVQVELGEL